MLNRDRNDISGAIEIEVDVFRKLESSWSRWLVVAIKKGIVDGFTIRQQNNRKARFSNSGIVFHLRIRPSLCTSSKSGWFNARSIHSSTMRTRSGRQLP